MCGIAGSFGAKLASDRVEGAIETLRQRGPDAKGFLERQLEAGWVTLLSTRLAIIDLDPRSDQPMTSGALSVAFNGEIYNYRELRNELQADGLHFETASDTEVLLHSYRRWGESCVHRFEGMWAFALLDEDKRILFMSRDRFGKKPLLWMQSRGSFDFASDVRSLITLSADKPSVNERHLRRFLVNGYKSLYKSADGFLRGVNRVPAGHNLLLREPRSGVSSSFWELNYEPDQMSLSEAQDTARSLTTEAVSLRLRADVPKALCLSGGIDSTVLAGLATQQGDPLETFTVIDRDERYDESTNARKTVTHLGLASTEIDSSGTRFVEKLSELVAYHMKPVATLSSLMQSLLFEEINASGYKVALSGTGADEIFTGYYDHYLFWLAEVASLSSDEDIDLLIGDWRESYGAYVRNPFLQDPLVFHKDPSARQHIYLDRSRFLSFLCEPDVEDFHEAALSSDLLRNRMLNELFYEAVPVLLEEEDLNSMMHSVEARTPYLDARLARFLFTVPTRHLIKDGWPKWLLRYAGGDLLPDEVVLDKRKRGFNVPITSLVDLEQPEVKGWLLEDGPLFDLVRRDRFEDFISSPITKNSESKFLFNCLSTKLFLGNYVDFQP